MLAPRGDPGPVRGHVAPVAVIVAAVLVANLATVLHLVSTDPMVLFGGLGHPSGALLPGAPAIDPNGGFVNQAVGHLAASSWLHGHVPWWNPYEGVGSPLAAEGQNAALSPLVLLLGWGQGLVVEHLLLEAFAGVATYFLLRRLGIGRALATGGGVAYGLCGTFAWFSGNPGPVLPFLPLALLGVEHAVHAARTGAPRGWRLAGIAVGLSVLAGFPETAFIDGLLVALWALARLSGLEARARLSLLAKMAAAVVVGAALAAPLEVAFGEYLPHAIVGGHNGGFATVSLQPAGMAQLLLPYGFGPVFGFHSAGTTDAITYQWGNIGGYLGVVLVFCGLLGVLGAGRSVLRWALVAWVALCLLRSYGFSPLVHLMAPIPGLHQVAFYRYDNPSWTLAVIVLGAMGADDVVGGRARRARVVVAFLVSAGLTAWAAREADRVMAHATGAAHAHRYVVASAAGAGAVLLVAGAGALVGAWKGAPGRALRSARRAKIAAVVMAGAMGAEAVVLLGVTQLSAPTSAPRLTGVATWLAGHLGTNRFVTFGPVQPNYGSYFGAAELNTNDLPFPKSWNRHISRSLDSNAPELSFTGSARIDPTGPTPAQELVTHVAAYEAAGVRYVVESPSGADAQGTPYPPPGSPPWPAGPRRVYRDTVAEVWELPAPAPAFTARPLHGGSASSPCRVRVVDWNGADVDCRTPALLERHVLDLPGWTASVGGRDVTVRASGPEGLFEQVSVPAGSSEVRFSYLPPHERVAIPLAGAALVLLLTPPVPTATRRSSRAWAAPPR